MTPSSRDLASSRDRLKTCLYYCNTYGHQTCEGSDLKWEAATHVVTRSFNHLILWGHATSKILYISTCTRPMATKHGKVTTYSEGLPPINSHNPLNEANPWRWTFKLKMIIILQLIHFLFLVELSLFSTRAFSKLHFFSLTRHIKVYPIHSLYIH